MQRLIPALLLIGLLKGCITVETKTPVPPPFVTSTLPAGPAPVSTPTPSPTSPGLAPRPAGCTDRAIFMQDVTVPDGTRMKSGQIFTKTWQLKNLGSCPWDAGYTLAFLAGERMGAPDSIPLAVTMPGETVDLSAELTAPSREGIYTGIFELRDPAGKVIPVGLDKSIWVKIIVGSGGYVPPAPSQIPGGVTPVVTANHCTVGLNEGYVSQLLDLINAARREAHIPELVVNPQLTHAAQGHSADMACNNFLAHTGSDGSYIDDRIRAAGYVPAYWLEIIAIGTPQDAMNQWQASPEHWQAVLDSKATEVGIGYAYYAQSDYGGYFTVDMGTR